MLVLITGIGNVGKSSFRRFKLQELRMLGCLARHYDHDKFNILRHPKDIDLLEKLPADFDPATIYLVEDVNAFEEDKALAIPNYNLIYYISSGFLSHILFWIPRIWYWFSKGKYSWQASSGWKGTGKACDTKNILPMLKTFFREILNRRKWIKKDLEVLKTCDVIRVRSCWSKSGVKFKAEIL